MPPDDRLKHLDVIRGLVLFGVLTVNIETTFRIPLLEHILGIEPGPLTPADQVIDFLVTHALQSKALTIFSFLFGAGIAIQYERLGRGASAFLARRLGWLFLFGLFHMVLIWNGDILALYAVAALLVLPVLDLRWPALLLIGTAAMAVPEFVSVGHALPSGNAARALMREARNAYGDGGLMTILRFRWLETGALIVPLLAAILPRTVGLVCWGMAAWRSGILREPQRHRCKLFLALAVGTLLGAWNPATPSLLATAYVAALLLLLTSPGAPSLPGLAATGRLALTNYLWQSIVLGSVFYGYGLGLFGCIGSPAAFGIGVAIFSAQVLLSRAWLSCFRFGPLEWLWRSLAYGTRQPMLRETSNVQKGNVSYESRPLR